MKIALVGYGKMGKEIERLAPAAGCEVVARFDIDNPLSDSGASDFDAAIEFSTPATVVENITWLAAHGKPVVVGTTGWYNRLPEVEKMIGRAGTALIHATNFSIGMYLFNRIIAEAARLYRGFPEYDISVHETHHTAKLDAPSGSALTIGETILREWKMKSRVVTGADDAPSDALRITSARIGNVVGEHTVQIASAADTITLTHDAHSRAGFAGGALLAAKWIVGKKGVFSFDDLMTEQLGGREA